MKNSIVVTTYNGERFIEEQLDSIAKQSVKPDEVWVFDDGSTDNTLKVVENFISLNSLNHWKLIKNEHNKGYARNFIEGIKKCKGELVFLCDQDDIWEKDKIEKMMDVFSNYKDATLVCCNLSPFYFEDGARQFDRKKLSGMSNDGHIEQVSFCEKNFFCQRSGCTMCIKKSFFDIISNLWVDDWPHDDFIWKMSVANETCYIINNQLINRRMHNNNTSTLKIRTRTWRIEQIKKMMRWYDIYKHYLANMSLEDHGIISKNEECLKIRLKALENRSIRLWLILYIQYKMCFPRIQTIFLDLYFLMFEEYKGVN